MNIFELSAAKREILEQIEDGTLTAEQAFDTLESIDESLEDKYDGYAAIDASLKLDEEALASEIKRLQARKTAIANERKRLRNNVLASLEALDMKRLKTNRFTISRMQRKAYVITDEEALPAKYRKREFIETIDKKAVEQDLKDGVEVEGAEIQDTQALQIR